MKKLIKLFFTIILSLSLNKTADAINFENILQNLQSYDIKTQIEAVNELGKIRDERSIQTLIDFIFTKTENWKVKTRAITILGEIPDVRIVDKLVTVFNDPFINYECPAMKWYTVIALGKNFNKGTSAVDTLLEALSYDNLLIKEAAIQSLGNTGDPSAIPYLLPLLDDDRFSIRYSVIKALGQIGDKDTVPYLRKIISEEKESLLKDEAINAIEYIERKSQD
ncbi:MAG: HEAT repeat domain-containing protein [Nitrospirae bacterium]|nr:HEAT repeat domain-containing protein [Nitrospirota bacterium]